MTAQSSRPPGTLAVRAPRLVAGYPWLIVLPPLVVLLPLALTFLANVVRFRTGQLASVAEVSAVLYGAGALVFAVAIGRCARRVDAVIGRNEDASSAVSACLAATEAGSLILWMGCGAVLALAGVLTLDRSFAGLQYFVEAVIIIAAPAMAWSYWAGKQMLLAITAGAHMTYRGRTYSIAIKIAMVFIGFFVVSVGALVLLVSSRVAGRLTAAGLNGESIAADVTRFGLIIAFVTAVVFAAATFFLARDVTAPMKELMHIAREMAVGHFDVEQHVFSDDEVGGLAESFAVTRNSLRSLLSKLGDGGVAITQGVREMSRGTTVLSSSAHEQQDLNQRSTESVKAVRGEAESVLDAVDKVAGVSSESASTAVELNASSAEVARRMDDLFRSVAKTSSSTTEIDATAREASLRTNDLAGLSAEVLTFVTQMDASVAEITRTSHTTAEISRRVHDDATAAREAVTATANGIHSAQESTRRTVGAFDDLQKSLGKIDQILVFIDSVTDETKLLSLNAAIIAAQAGGNDFGFSVIADEISQLSERTRNATAEIAEIIRGLRPMTKQTLTALAEGVETVDRSVDLAGQASKTLDQIAGSSDDSLEMVQTMSKALEEQAVASRHLHDVTARMSDTIREIHRANQGQAEATRLLAMESEHVRGIAEQVNRAAGEQRVAADGISKAMEQIAADVRVIRDRLERQLLQAEQITSASQTTLTIAQKNSTIADDFKRELEALFASAGAFEQEVGRFRV